MLHVSTPVVTAGDQANGHVRPSSSLRFVQYGLDCGGWLAFILDIAGVWADWNRSDMHLTSGSSISNEGTMQLRHHTTSI